MVGLALLAAGGKGGGEIGSCRKFSLVGITRFVFDFVLPVHFVRGAVEHVERRG